MYLKNDFFSSTLFGFAHLSIEISVELICTLNKVDLVLGLTKLTFQV